MMVRKNSEQSSHIVKLESTVDRLLSTTEILELAIQGLSAQVGQLSVQNEALLAAQNAQQANQVANNPNNGGQQQQQQQQPSSAARCG